MLLTLVLLSALSKAPAEGLDPETVTFLFRAGDLPRALDVASKCKKFTPKACTKMVKALVEYMYLQKQADTLTPQEVRTFLDADRLLSPKEPGKLSVAVWDQYVHFPLAQATEALKAGQPKLARSFVDKVLAVDAKNARALELSKACVLAGDGGN